MQRLGVAQLGDGLVALPFDTSTKEALEWVANMVTEADGTATIWIATPTLKRFGRDLVATLRAERAREYATLVERARAMTEEAPNPRTLHALRAELRRIERRDYFPPPEREAARRAVESVTEGSATR